MISISNLVDVPGMVLLLVIFVTDERVLMNHSLNNNYPDILSYISIILYISWRKLEKTLYGAFPSYCRHLPSTRVTIVRQSD